ncbi:MAG: polysaccharide biosynthesis tyrosine autokinase [Bacteroidales bacterium]|nr:polysaccharide biosynthesis tyrosine autokinase [Bacteroidales bacterium]
MSKRDIYDEMDFVSLNDRSDREGSSLAKLFSTVLFHRKWFILSVLICGLIGFLYVRSTPKTFRRTATVLVQDDRRGGVMSESAAFEDLFFSARASVDNEIGVFKSKRLMYDVAKQLRLDVSYKIRDGLRDRELYSSTPIIVDFTDIDPLQSISMTATLLENRQVELQEFQWGKEESNLVKVLQPGDTLRTPVGDIIVTIAPLIERDYIGKPVQISKRSLKAVSDSYNARLKVDVDNKMSSIINLTLEDVNIKRAEDVINTLIEVYKNDAILDKNQVLESTANFIRERLIIIEAELSDVDSKIEQYKRDHQLTDIRSESALYLQSSGRLDTEVLSLENQLDMAEFMKVYLQDNSKLSDPIPASIGISDSGIQNQISEYNSLLAQRNKLLANSSENNPLVREMDNTLAATRFSISKAVDNLIAGLKIQIENMRQKEISTRGKISTVPMQHKYITSIERQQKIKEELYLYLLNKKEENELQATIMASNCRIIDPADGLNSPVSPNKVRVVLISFIIGLLIPGLWLYIRSLLNTAVYTKKELKEALTVPFLGEIPLVKTKSKELIVVEENSTEPICEALKIVHSNLEFMDTEHKGGGKVIMVTSVNQDAGKTFITANLGMSMATVKEKVVVIDLDLRKGTLTKRLGIGTKQPGVSNYLAGMEDNIFDSIHPYKESSLLDIVPCGTIPPNPADLLKSDRLDKLIAELRTKYDYVLLDTPPFGVVVDVQLCARVADQTIYVVRSGMLDKRVLPEIQELYNSGKMNNMSILLNGIDIKKIASYGTYGYGYGYGRKYGYGYGYGYAGYGYSYTQDKKRK